MNKSSLTPSILKKLAELEEKYSLTGQDLMSNLEGLHYANYLKYWDYVHLDTLLSLQNPRTDFPDEKIFIVYHQITELYFNLILWEMEQIANCEDLTADWFTARLQRINRYLQNLTFSFDIMVEGMEIEQFRKFRMALLPASGFQSAQFRMIEICATDFVFLLTGEGRKHWEETYDVAQLYPFIYWKKGATDEHTGEETITAKHFQEHYQSQFIQMAKDYKEKNIWQRYRRLSAEQKTDALQQALRKFDQLINIDWRLSHYRSAVRYLKSKDEAIAATGGTNWQRYLPPRFQRVIFYPDLWQEEEKANWGKTWVDQQLS